MSEGNSIEQKEAAISRHYDTATNPYISEARRVESGNALRILGRDTGRQIIINILAVLARTGKRKERLKEQ
jgi:hypothetical protein